MNKKGVILEPTVGGLYDLTITEDGKPIKVVRFISRLRAKEVIEQELEEERK